MNSSKQIRFGIFEVRVDVGELRKAGRPIRLQEQPFRILKCLLARPGEVVTRDELRKQIWGDDVYVDFDRSLNTAIARVREVLGDSPTRPIFIETVPRKGYRFIAKIGPPDEQEVSEPSATAPEQPWRSRGAKFGLLAGGIAVVAVVAGFYWRLLPPKEAPGPPAVPERLTSYLGAEDEPTFSPDGSHFAFTWNGEKQDNYDIYVRSIAGGAPLRLTDHPNRESSPVWSPDGQWIAFGRHLDDDGVGIFRLSPFGGREQKVLSLPYQGSNGMRTREMAWAPDSEHLAIIERHVDRDDSSIVLLNMNTGTRQTLLNSRNVLQPSFSPNGRYLAFADYGKGCFILALSGAFEPAGDPSRLDLGQSCFSPVWSAGGTRLVMEVGFEGSLPALWSAEMDGSDAKPLHVRASAYGSSLGLRPAVGSNGRLAYRQDLTKQSIWRLDLQSGEAEPLIESSGFNFDPAYSPDGRKILFLSTRGPVGVWIANADGGDASLFVEGGADARWSLDGTKVVFRALRPGNPSASGPQDIWIIDAEGGPATNLTDAPSREAAPMWSRDGQWIYLLSDGRLCKMPSTGGEMQVILDRRSAPIDQPHDTGWLYLSTGSSASATVSRLSAQGAHDIMVNNVIGWSGFSVAADGLYFQAGSLDSGYEIRFYRFTDRSISVVYRMTGRAGTTIDLSPDGRYLLFSQRESEQSDLMLLDRID